jgi:signal transduction histidine kinase
MAAMGEMIGNIAHQWRQPLSAISATATGLKIQKELDCLSPDEIDSSLTAINNSVQYLSKTIDDFRGFLNPNNKDRKIFMISDSLDKALNLVSSQFAAKEIEIIKDIEEYELFSIENELVQVFINIFNNSKDILITKENQKRLIFIKTYKKNNSFYIEIKDNGGGIKDSIIERIFEPYFTTKHQSQGTGIGLYMSQEIVRNHLNGTLMVENATYMYKDIEYIGAKFTIKIIIV